MLIDSSHERWAVAVAAVAAVLVGAHRLAGVPEGTPPGLAPLGLAAGVAALAILLFCAALPLRRRLLGLEVGTASSWLRAHIWLGLLAWPLVLVHSGFRAGGSLALALVVLLALVVASGLLGLALQNVLPRVISEEVPHERTGGTIPRVRRNLELEAYDAVAEACGPVAPAAPALAAAARAVLAEVAPARRAAQAAELVERIALAQGAAGGSTAEVVPVLADLLRPLAPGERGRVVEAALAAAARARAPLETPGDLAPLVEAVVAGASAPDRRAASALCLRAIVRRGGAGAAARDAVAEMIAGAFPEGERAAALADLRALEASPPPRAEARAPLGEGRAELRDLYVEAVLPFLADPRRAARLWRAARSRIIFEATAARLPEELRPALRRLERCVDAARSTARQEALEALLEAWLVVHVPASFALLALTLVHAVTALYW